MSIYRPENYPGLVAQNATLGVKFSRGARILDPWYILGGTKWSRFKFRLKHPIVYSKRGMRRVYRKIRSLFINDRTIPCIPRVWKFREELLHLYPENKDAL